MIFPEHYGDQKGKFGIKYYQLHVTKLARINGSITDPLIHPAGRSDCSSFSEKNNVKDY